MYSFKTKKLPKSTVEITVTLPKDDIKVSKEEAFKRLAVELTVEGFRKGKVPEAIARKHVSLDALYQEMMKVILPKMYDEIIKKESIKPIMSPKIELVKAKEGEDWEIKISVCEKPVIELGDYKKAIKDVKAKHKSEDIWVPGKESPTQT